MSTAIAAPPMASMPNLDHNPSPRSYPPLAPLTAAPPVERHIEIGPGHDYSRPQATPPDPGRISPRSLRSTGGGPKIVVKKEPPSSPSMQASRHRPKKLDLNTSSIPHSNNSRPSATPLTARDSLTAMHDVGLACLSPGIQTDDPTIREQLQRSLSVREQQRNIIEQRLLKSAKGDAADISRSDSLSSGKAPPPSTKKRPPPGLSIVPPAAERFANERIVQSAPLNQTFTGRHQPPPHQQHGNSSLAQSTNIHHVPAMQTANRLPPISDVFGANDFNPGAPRPPFLHSNSTPGHVHGPPIPSPSYPPQTAHPMSQSSHNAFGERPREYRSAEEAVQDMIGDREDLRPKIVHYGGHQPPTPPSPHPNQSHENLTPHKYQHASGSFGAGRRRSRNEYEAGSSPPLGKGRGERPLGPFGDGRDSPATQRAKKEEFLSLCSRAWDLFHN